VSEEQRLDRSVLEGKKADEVRAIAAAVGVPLSGRPTKAGVIDQILQFTGVTVSDQSSESAVATKPRRARTPRAKTEAEATSSSPSADAPAAPNKAASTEAAPEAKEAKESNGRSGRGGGSRDAADRGATDKASPNGSSGKGDEGTSSAATTGEEGANPRPQRNNDRNNNRGFDTYDAQGGGRNSRRRRGRRERGPAGQGGQGGQGNADRGNRNTGGGENYDRNVEQAEAAFQGEPVPVTGFLELRDEGFGFLRTNGFLASAKDVYVPVSQVRKYVCVRVTTLSAPVVLPLVTRSTQRYWL